MTFGVDIASEMPALQAEAESLMQDTCRVVFPSGRTTQDEDTGKEVAVYITRLMSNCKVQVGGLTLAVSDRQAGGTLQTSARGEVHFPAGTSGIEVGDVIEIVDLGPAATPLLLGRKFRVTGFNPKSWQTALKVEVEDVL